MPYRIASILNLLESLRAKSQVQEFLESREIPSSGTWPDVRRHIESALTQRRVTPDELVNLLEEIEEHGFQYAYFYDFDVSRAPHLRTRESLRGVLTDAERGTVMDRIRVIESPSAEPVLVSAKHQDGEVKLKWVQRRSFRRPLGESTHGDIVTVRYQIVYARAVDIAVFNLAANSARLFVQKIEPSIRDYRKQLAALQTRLERFVERDALTSLDLGNVLKKLNEEEFAEARRRRCQARDESGAIVDVTSATETDDIFDAGLYKAARENYSGSVASLHANAYWKPVASFLEREMHTIFPYRQSPNAVILTQRCVRTERDYVLSRIESIARGES